PGEVQIEFGELWFLGGRSGLRQLLRRLSEHRWKRPECSSQKVNDDFLHSRVVVDRCFHSDTRLSPPNPATFLEWSVVAQPSRLPSRASRPRRMLGRDAPA